MQKPSLSIKLLAVFSGAINCNPTSDEEEGNKSLRSCILHVRTATKCQPEVSRRRAGGASAEYHQWVSASVCKAPPPPPCVRGRQIAGSESGSMRKNKSLDPCSGNNSDRVRNINPLTFTRRLYISGRLKNQMCCEVSRCLLISKQRKPPRMNISSQAWLATRGRLVNAGHWAEHRNKSSWGCCEKAQNENSEFYCSQTSGFTGETVGGQDIRWWWLALSTLAHGDSVLPFPSYQSQITSNWPSFGEITSLLVL